MTPDAVMLPVLVSKVSGFPLLLMAPVRVREAVVDWMMPPPVPLMVICRSVLTAGPVYDRIAEVALPSRSGVVDTVDPNELGLLPFASVPTLSVPPLIVV